MKVTAKPRLLMIGLRKTATKACTRMSSRIHPTALKMTVGERQAEMKLLASSGLVSPTSISIEGLRVEPKLTKQ